MKSINELIIIYIILVDLKRWYYNYVNMKTINIKKTIIYTFFLFYFFVGCLTYDDYGINIEEHTQLFSGAYWLNYIFEFFRIDFL